VSSQETGKANPDLLGKRGSNFRGQTAPRTSKITADILGTPSPKQPSPTGQGRADILGSPSTGSASNSSSGGSPFAQSTVPDVDSRRRSTRKVADVGDLEL
jgi:hypothetical protein